MEATKCHMDQANYPTRPATRGAGSHAQLALKLTATTNLLMLRVQGRTLRIQLTQYSLQKCSNDLPAGKPRRELASSGTTGTSRGWHVVPAGVKLD